MNPFNRYGISHMHTRSVESVVQMVVRRIKDQMVPGLSKIALLLAMENAILQYGLVHTVNKSSICKSWDISNDPRSNSYKVVREAST